MASRPSSAIERRLFAVALSCAFALAIVPSWADEPPPSAQALFDAAISEMKDGHWDTACPKLEASDRLEASGGTALNLGYCLEHLTTWDRAYEAYVVAAEHYVASGKPDRQKVALEHATAIRDRITFVRLTGTDAGKLGAVELDGRPRAFHGGALFATRGPHTLRFSLAGETRTIEFDADAAEVALVLPAVAERSLPQGPLVLPPPPPLARSTPALAPAPANGKRTAAWISGGIGVALVGTAIVTGALALSRQSASDDACPQEQCTQAGVDAHRDAQVFAITTDVVIVTAVVALGISTYLFLTSRPSKVALAPFAVSF